MKRLVWCVLILTVVFLNACSSGQASKAMLGKMAPYTRFTMLNGDLQSIPELQGKPAIIVFWAAWCAKSARTLETLNNYAQAKSLSDKVWLLAVNLDKEEKLEEVKERIRYGKFAKFANAFSGNEYYDEAYVAFKGELLPYVIVVDAHGKIVSLGNDAEVVEPIFGKLDS